MSRARHTPSSNTATWSYVSIGLALLAVAALGVAGAYRDIALVRTALLKAEVARLQLYANRMVGSIESQLEMGGDGQLSSVAADTWLKKYWEQLAPHQGQTVYTALVSAEGKVIKHSDSSLEGRELPRRWYTRVLTELEEDDVVLTQCPALTGGIPAIDLHVPIYLGTMEVGEYHVGFDEAWFDRWVQEEQRQMILGRAAVICAVLVVIFLAFVSLYRLAERKAALWRAMDDANSQRNREVGQLAAGLAHEIRNPLHAIRLNLHLLARCHEDPTQLGKEEIAQVISESNSEIDRLDGLMRELLGFANPEEGKEEEIDVQSELQATLSFLSQELQRKHIRLTSQFLPYRVCICMDPGRFRQVTLNLLMNARDAVQDAGSIDVQVLRSDGRIHILVCDNGPGVAVGERERIFEPFYSTKAEGSGLGLALARRFVEEADGELTCEINGNQGATFRISLPEAARSGKNSFKTKDKIL